MNREHPDGAATFRPGAAPMDAEMIEKVARAIHGVDDPEGVEWGAERENIRDIYRRFAVAAIAALSATPQAEPAIGPEWRPCRKRPVIVHVREQRPGEQHVSTREGITPVKPDDLIMRGVEGEEYPIGRGLFARTYDLVTDEPAAPQAAQVPSMRDRLQQRCSDWGVYWRSSDAHGVELTKEQALDLLCDALGVEVEIKPQAAQVPEGYALVPVEPTEAMLDAAGECIVPAGKEWLDQSNRELWAAMLAAAQAQGVP